MIQANELRVGNWITGNFPFMIIKQVSCYGVDLYMPQCEADDFSYDLEEIEPIPLTPEILEQCDFVFDGASYLAKDGIGQISYRVHLWVINNTIMWVANEGFSVTLNSLHQLQNLYYALTGKELEIKLKTPDHG
jgi:hypothetical protein